MIQYYLSCGVNPDETVDFFAYSNYGCVRKSPVNAAMESSSQSCFQCGDSPMSGSGYNIMLEYGFNSNIPIFFEEGCNIDSPRGFSDQASIFGPDMEDVWSGTVIYKWVEAPNDYGSE
jgi:hypothetical protein